MTNDDKIKTGDVVTLKSGGPLMTVGQVGPREDDDDTDPNECICAWFCTVQRLGADIYGEPMRGVFHVDTLKKVETTPDDLRAAAEDVYAHLTAEGHLPRGAGLLTRLGRALGKGVL